MQNILMPVVHVSEPKLGHAQGHTGSIMTDELCIHYRHNAAHYFIQI